jgi:hypothetical protein
MVGLRSTIEQGVRLGVRLTQRHQTDPNLPVANAVKICDEPLKISIAPNALDAANPDANDSPFSAQ